MIIEEGSGLRSNGEWAAWLVLRAYLHWLDNDTMTAELCVWLAQQAAAGSWLMKPAVAS